MSIDLSFLYPFYSIDPRAVWKGQFALLLIFGAAAAVMVIPLDPKSSSLRWFKRAGIAVIMLMAMLQFILLIGYLFYPSYFNHMEATVAAVSWLGWEGYPLYPRLDTGDAYGLPYGPVLFQLTGFFLWLFGPSIGASKILGLSAFVLSQLLSFATLRRVGAGVAEALTMTGVQCVVLAGFTDQGYVSGVRSDALLFLAAQTAVFVATFAPTMLTASGLGFLGAVCVNLKIHGALYILPAFAYHLSRSSNTMIFLRLTCISGLTAVVALVIPFITNNASFFDYLNYFKALKNTPINRWLFEQDIVFVGMCLSPFLAMYVLFTPKLPRTFVWFMATTALCMIAATLPASANGAGPYHLLPFLPSLIWGFVVMRREVSAALTNLRARGRYEGLSLGLIVALLVGFGPIVISSWGTVLGKFIDTPLLGERAAEIEKALDDNPGLKVSVGPGAGGTSLDAEILRVIPVFRGNPLPIDSSSWMTFEPMGISDQIIRRAIRECRIDLWLLPSDGQPFVVISHLDGKNIYSDEVIADFNASYIKQQHSGHGFDQWKCKQHDDAAAGRGRK